MKIAITAVAAAFTVATTGCATIVSDSSYPTSFNSTPSGAQVTVTDEDGVDVVRDTTPFTTTLKASNGYFNRMQYTATFHKACYEDTTVPLKGGLDGWYWGNLAFGGIIGMLIVDPATGSMFKVDSSQSVAMTPVGSLSECTDPSTARLEPRAVVPWRLVVDR